MNSAGDGQASRATVVWRLLVALDVVIVAVFAVAAATEPHGVLEQEGVDLPNFRGLLPLVVVVVLRGATLMAERHLLPEARGGLVLAERLASAVAFYYAGVWLFERQYSQWQEIVLGGTLGYSLVGIAGVGVIALVHAWRRWRARDMPPTPETTASAHSDIHASQQPARQRRAIARESAFGLVGVFVGVAGLVASVTDIARIAVALVVGALVTGGVAVLARTR